MTSDLLKTALKYVDMGFFILPCREQNEGKYLNKKLNKWIDLKAKQPRLSNGLHGASNNPDQIKEWWTRSGKERSAIGINCGLSKLFVIDIDNHEKNGIENFEKLLISHENAWHSFTANGGMHIIFFDPKSIGRTSTNSKLGIDTRGGNGGYFIAPPSCIYEEGKETKCYVALEEWKELPQEITSDNLKRLGLFRDKPITKKEAPYFPQDKQIIRVRRALDRISTDICDNYHSWIEIGMALYSLGNDGLMLWREWSMKSSKYQNGVCEEKWDTFKVDQISLGTIFHYAKEANHGKK